MDTSSSELKVYARYFYLLSAIVLSIHGVFLWFNYSKLPNIVPTHFNGSGVVDGTGSKNSLFLLLGISVAMFVLFHFVAKLKPSKINIPQTRKVNKERERKAIPLFINSMNLVIQLGFFYISYSVIKIALNQKESLGVLFTFLFILFTIIPIIFFSIYTSGKSQKS